MKMRKCCVKGCTSVKRNPKISFFNATKANYLAWNLAVSNANCEKTIVKRVCAEHFKPEDIINTYSVPHDVANEVGNRIKIGLKKGIVPSIFPSIDKKSNEILSSVNNSDHNYANCSRKQVNKPDRRKLLIKNISDDEVIIIEDDDIEPNEEPPNERLKLFEENIHEILTFNDLSTWDCEVIVVEDEDIKPNEEHPNKCLKLFEENIHEILTFNDLTMHVKRVVLPEGWTSYLSNDEIVFYKPKFNDGKMKIEKQLVFKSTLEICIYVYQFTIQIEKISSTLKYPISLTNLSQVIKVLDFKKMCGGGPRSIDFPGVRVKSATLENNQLWRHKKCPILIDVKTKKCSACNYLIKYLKKSSERVKQSPCIGCTLTPTRCKIVKNLKKSNARLHTSITKINIELKELQEKHRQYQKTEQNKS